MLEKGWEQGEVRSAVSPPELLGSTAYTKQGTYEPTANLDSLIGPNMAIWQCL